MTKHERNFGDAEMIDATIAEIKRSNDFDMGSWRTCIVAHAEKAAGLRRDKLRDPVRIGQEILGLDYVTAQYMFCSDASKKEAVEMLKLFRDTGRASWLEAYERAGTKAKPRLWYADA